jgi:hypothetical protein
MMDLPPAAQSRLTPSLTAWRDWLGPLIDEAMLAEIAAADYGYLADENLVALRAIRDGRLLDAPGVVAPLEVLQLVRWSWPDDPAEQPSRRGRRGHLMRLFCCAALIWLADDPARRPACGDEEDTLLPLVDSAIALGAAAVAAVLPLLTARLLTLPATDLGRPFFAMSLLLLAAAQFRDEADGLLLNQLGHWVVAEEAHFRAAGPPLPPLPVWLLGLKSSANGDDLWRELAWRLLVEPAVPHPAQAAATLYAVGARLVLGEPDGSDQAQR